MKMAEFLGNIIAHLSRVEFQKFWVRCYKASLIGMNLGGGDGVESSGERYIIEYINKNFFSGNKAAIIFDVGANIGEYTGELLTHIRNAEIHSFEPARSTYEILCKNIVAENVILNNFGISDKCSEGILYYEKENSGIASLYQRQLDYIGIDFSKSEAIILDTIDHYCKEKNITYIDFLKIDIEGNELKALYGAHKMLEKNLIGIIQIEFGGCNIDSRTYFRDFWNLLHEKFRAYRIIRNGLYEIKKYEEILEIFTCTNYLFINKFIGH